MLSSLFYVSADFNVKKFFHGHAQEKQWNGQYMDIVTFAVMAQGAKSGPRRCITKVVVLVLGFDPNWSPGGYLSPEAAQRAASWPYSQQPG